MSQPVRRSARSIDITIAGNKVVWIDSAVKAALEKAFPDARFISAEEQESMGLRRGLFFLNGNVAIWDSEAKSYIKVTQAPESSGEDCLGAQSSPEQ